MGSSQVSTQPTHLYPGLDTPEPHYKDIITGLAASRSSRCVTRWPRSIRTGSWVTEIEILFVVWYLTGQGRILCLR